MKSVQAHAQKSHARIIALASLIFGLLLLGSGNWIRKGSACAPSGDGAQADAVAGDLDTTFDPGTGPDDEVLSTAVQPDGKILIGGKFHTYRGVSRDNIARVNPDGTLDTSFNPGTGTRVAGVYAIKVLPDNKILIDGLFYEYNGTARAGIARLNPDGSLDTSFDPGTGTSDDGQIFVYEPTVLTTALQPDGKIIIGGRFASYNGTARIRLARINSPDSTPTPTPTPTATPTLTSNATLSFDGRLRDRVKRGDGIAGLGGDGDPDGTFTLTLAPGNASKFITKVDLCQKSSPCTPQDTNVNRWDTVPGNPFWALGVTDTLDGQLLNSADSSVSFQVGNAGTFKLFAASDANSNAFVQGSTHTVTVTFNDNTTLSATTTISQTPAVDLAITDVAGVPNAVAEGQDIVYQIAVRNKGTMMATGVLVKHTLQINQFNNPNELFVGYGIDGTTGRCVLVSGDRQVQCTLNGGFTPGQVAQVNPVLRFLKAIPGAGSAEFTVFYDRSDANSVDNTRAATINVQAPNAPPNDNLVPLLTQGATLPSAETGGVTGSNVGATYEGCKKIGTVQICEPFHAGVEGGPAYGKSIWYSWRAPRDGNVAFTTAGTKFDTVLAVYYMENFQIRAPGRTMTARTRATRQGRKPATSVSMP